MNEVYATILAALDFADFVAVIVAIGVAVIGVTFVISLLESACQAAAGELGDDVDDPKKKQVGSDDRVRKDCDRRKRKTDTEYDNDYC